MRIVVAIRPKIPVDEYTSKQIQHLESRFEDITFVRTAEFDPKLMKAYIQYEDPQATDDDDRSDSIDKSAFRNAVNLTEEFTYV
jgi:hypothetical protein